MNGVPLCFPDPHRCCPNGPELYRRLNSLHKNQMFKTSLVMMREVHHYFTKNVVLPNAMMPYFMRAPTSSGGEAVETVDLMGGGGKEDEPIDLDLWEDVNGFFASMMEESKRDSGGEEDS